MVAALVDEDRVCFEALDVSALCVQLGQLACQSPVDLLISPRVTQRRSKRLLRSLVTVSTRPTPVEELLDRIERSLVEAVRADRARGRSSSARVE